MKLLNRLILGRHCKTSYSQCGEDLIIGSIFSSLKIPYPSYLDIGAHDPIYLSNTYLFYGKGSRGVCVEPNPALCEKIRKTRKKDVCIVAGIGTESVDNALFYLMNEKALSTFSKEAAERYQDSSKVKIEDILRIPLISINECLGKYFPSCPNFVSLDIEGEDLAVLESIDYDHYRPQVFCIETLTYTEDNSERKKHEIIEFMIGKGYMNYADTYVNTVFVDKEPWKNR